MITFERLDLPDGGVGCMTPSLVKEAWEDTPVIQQAFASPAAFWSFSEDVALRTASTQYSFFDNGVPIGGIMLVEAVDPLVGRVLTPLHIFVRKAYRGRSDMARMILRSALAEASARRLAWLSMPSGAKGTVHSTRYIKVK